MENQAASSPSAAKPSLFRRLLNVNTQSSACCCYKLCMHDEYSKDLRQSAEKTAV